MDYSFFNASIYNVLSLAICLNNFAFCLLNYIIDLFKSYTKFIDKLKNISVRANLSPNNIQNKSTQGSKDKKTKKKLKPILTTRRTPTHT